MRVDVEGCDEKNFLPGSAFVPEGRVEPLKDSDFLALAFLQRLLAFWALIQ